MTRAFAKNMRKLLIRFIFGLSALLNILLTSLMLHAVATVQTEVDEISMIRHLHFYLSMYVEEQNEFPANLSRDLESYLSDLPELKEFISRKGFSYSRPTTPPEETDPEVIVFIYKTEGGLYTGDLNGSLHGYR